MESAILALMTFSQIADALSDPIWDSHAAAMCSSDALPIPGELPIPLQRAIERFSVRHELWDGPGWNWTANASGEIAWVRTHYRLDYPTLADLSRFPDAAEVKRRMDDARSHIARLESIQSMVWDKGAVAGMILEAQCAMGPWARLQAAQSDKSANKTTARSELSALRLLIGDHAYHVGLMPLHVPPTHYTRR